MASNYGPGYGQQPNYGQQWGYAQQPGYAPPGYPPGGYGNPPNYAAPPVRKPEGLAVALEAILALFGIYGVGWLLSGKIGVGLCLMVAGFAWDFFASVGTILSGGLGGCCFFPLHLLFLTASTVALANQRL